MVMNRRLTLARWSLGNLHGEDLPPAACELLAAGFDNQWLREVAALDSPTLRDAADTFDRGLRAAGFQPHAHELALGVMAWETARSIVAGALQPYAGAQVLSGLASDSRDYPELFAFYEFVDAYCGYLEGRPDIDGEIIVEAQKFIAAHPELAA